MFESPEAVNSVHVPERRVHARLRADSRAFVDLGEGKSGAVLNVGEGGLALQVAVPLTEQPHVPLVRLGLAISENRVEINGQIAWVSESSREVGIRFVDLQEETRSKIRDWISLESSQGRFQKESAAHGEGHQLLRPAPACHVREIRLDHDLRAFLEGWRECNRCFHDHTIHCDPDWIEARFKQQKENVRIYFLVSERRVIGAVPFVLSQEPLLCSLGESIVAKFPLHILSLQGYTPNMPAETSVYDMLFGRILESEFDAIQLSHVKSASFLWSYLHSSPLIQKFFRFYTQSGPLPHPLIRLNGSFADYMNKFSPKARKNRYREIKRLRARGDMQLIRVTKASEIDAFLAAAYGISQKTWQFVRRRWGIGARDIDVVRSEMQFLAQRGWLRSYLLKCGAVPCRARSLSGSSMARPSIPHLLEWTLRGGVIVRERFSSCSFWKTCSEKTHLSFMTWMTISRTKNILPTKAIRKHLSGSSAAERIRSWHAASTALATQLRRRRALYWTNFI
jgi:hypothetical protein